MAFDVYAGGFARYFAREWENVVQAHARETGTDYQMIYAEDNGPADWDEVAEAVGEWRAALINGLGDHAPPDLDWSEERGAPYFTDRPGWDGYSALVVLAACSALDEPLPAELSEDALASDVVERSQEQGRRDCNRVITQAQLWLPGSFEFSFDCPDLCNQPTHLGSVQRLVADLEALQQKLGISDEDLARACQEGVSDEANLPTIAIFGLGLFLNVAREAKTHNLPIMLSF